jgi:hypothetical protein
MRFTGASGVNITVNATNVIASGSPADIRVETVVGGSATVVLDHSNYDTISASAGGGTEGITLPGSGTNQIAPPIFQAGGGNFHQAAGSPTIDMGATNPLDGGTLDLDGEPRAQGAAQDIGADEFTFVPSPPQPAGPAIADLLSAKAKGTNLILLLGCPSGGGVCANQIALRTAKPVSPSKAATAAKAKRILLGGASISIPAGRTQTVRVPLTKRARKLFETRRKVRATATISGGGASTTAGVTIKRK